MKSLPVQIAIFLLTNNFLNVKGSPLSHYLEVTIGKENTNNDDSNGGPRIVTNLEVIYGSFGLPVQYWYNETHKSDDSKEKDEDNNLVSAPGCPKSIEGFPWIYYGNPPRCYLAGHHGPCPIGQKLFIQQLGSLFGKCACECLLEEEDYTAQLKGPNRYHFCKSSSPSETAPYGQIYDKQEEQCFSLFSQGPCKNGTVVADYKNSTLSCLPICENGTELHSKRENCKQLPTLGDTSSQATSISRDDCAKTKRYSKVLRKCVNRSPKQRLIIG